MFYFFPSNLVLFLPNFVFSINFLDSFSMVSLNFNNQKYLEIIYLVNETTRLTIHSHRDMQNMQDSYLNSILRFNIHRHWSISWFDLSVLTYFWFIHPKFGKFRDIRVIQ